MQDYAIPFFLQRILWPLIIILCALIRPTGTSLSYLLMFFMSPFVPILSKKTSKGPAVAYFTVWIALSSLILVSHLGMQITILTMGKNNLFLKCSFTEILLRHLGFINFTDLAPSAIAEWLIPDVLSFLVSLTLFVILRNFVTSSVEDTTPQTSDEEGLQNPNEKSEIIFQKLVDTGPYASLLSLYLMAILRPSVPGGIYFIVALGSGTYWACYKSLGSRFRIVLLAVMFVLIVHILSILTYQTPWPQEFLKNSTLLIRLAGLESLFISQCFNEDDIRLISFNKSVNIDSYVNPIAMLICYYIIAMVYKNLSTKKLAKRIMHRNKNSNKEQISLTEMENRLPEKHKVSVCYQTFSSLKCCGNFLYINSYIFTSIIMMVWSIVYHSWLTFLMLIWANILWMIPNQRKIMLRSSPFIVLYAEMLLVSQYIYALNLTDDELPSAVEVRGINLRQIGFVKPTSYPCIPLFVKMVFIVMFWTTMRQLFRERFEVKRNLSKDHLTKPLQSTIDGDTAGLSIESDAQEKQINFTKFGDVFKNTLYKLWIWLLILVIFLCGITGNRMTGFRICYMALFLFFILSFQLSWRSWTKLMYGYWLVLIVYAMTILILIYTYQFDQFDIHWRTYFGISLTLQKDIGLEKYKTQDLLLHLVNPTIIVVMTVIQVHYFHAKFLLSLTSVGKITVEYNKTNEKADFGEGTSHSLETNQEKKAKKTLFTNISPGRLNRLIRTSGSSVSEILDYLWTVGEMHLMKVILFVIFCCCLTNVCVLHIGVTILTVLAAISRMKVQLFITRITSIFVAILLLTKMIYQVDYINHKMYDAACDENSTIILIHINNAEWFGLFKTSEVVGLAALLKGYIAYMIVVTAYSVIIFRQGYKRQLTGVENKQPSVLFEGVTRKDADKDLIGLIKFLVNYSYFKFGYEVSLIVLVVVISIRQDLLALVYVGWLCIFFKLNRSYSSKLWAPFQFFVAVVIILQYLLFVGLPPGLCMEWPWNNSSYAKGLQLWALVPGQHLYKQTNKLLLDFVLLIFIHRQQRVFILEKKLTEADIPYQAGTNKSIMSEIDNLDVTPLDNPVPDFISNSRNWLDVLKVAVFNGWFWITLAVVFLAGTYSISIFFIGYLIGSFIFLWQGSDFYLRPVRNILKWWKMLMTYNVFVIAAKTISQIGGCLFLNTLERQCCWFVHLFAISCNLNTAANTYGGTISPVNECPETQEKTGLTWDALCFAFLLLQFRIFQTYYFHHIINDAKASTTMACRGAELIENLRENQIQFKKWHEKNIIRQIKLKMEKIRLKQERLLQQSTEMTHYSDTFLQGDRNTCNMFSPITHPSAIRSGDYYMFDDIDEKVDLGVNNLEDDYFSSRKKDNELFSKTAPEKVLQTKVPQPEDTAKAEGSISPQQERGAFQKAVNNILTSLLLRLKRISRNYRYVMKILQNEKATLMELKGFGLGARTGAGRIWTPFKYSKNVEFFENKRFEDSNARPSETKDLDSEVVGFSSEENVTLSKSSAWKKRSIFANILVAIWYAVLANTDLLCYFAAFLNQVAAASLLSLPIPLMIFLWGTLSVPRPTKTFWITLIAYTQTIVLIKCVFQFKMIWFNQSNDIWTTAKIIGIQFADGTAGYDLFLLLMLFFHRFLLKSQGLWKSKYTTESIADGAYVVDNRPNQSDCFNRSSSEHLRETALIKKDDSTLLLVRQDPEEIVNEDDVGAHVSNFMEEPGNYLPDIVKETFSRYCSPLKFFLQDLLRKARLPSDVYAYMFFCDFIIFLIIVFGFSAFDNQRADGGFQTYLEENRVPLSFLIMLILQFILIIIDRILYLRKAIRYRLGFHFFLVLGIHVWMFFIIPMQQGRVFNTQFPTIVFYLMKCIYFILSSYQLRCGYPARIGGNFFTKGYSIINMVSFKIYMAIPLLYEFRALLDWVCTDTTMTVFEWLKMEDLFSEIFTMKCFRQMESDMPVPRGIKKPVLTKALMGGGIIFVLFFLIWGPFVIFALSSAVGVSNIPSDVSISLRVGPFEPVYKMSAQDSSIHSFNQMMMDQFEVTYMKSKIATTFLSDYDPSDVAAIVLGSNSASLWNISPPDKARFLEDLETNQTLTCRFEYTISRKSAKKDTRSVSSEENTFELSRDHPGRVALIEMLQGRVTTIEVKLAGILPKFLKVKGNGDLKPVSQLMPISTDFRDVTIKYNFENTTNQSWWQLNEFCGDGYHHNVLSQLPLSNCESKIVLYTFSDKLFPSFLSFFTAGGIIGMYTTIVLVGSRFLRAFITGTRSRVMFEELPYVDRVLQLCFDIYLVREAKEFALEEDLFAKLLFLYRSPETMVRWTRPISAQTNNEEEGGEKTNT